MLLAPEKSLVQIHLEERGIGNHDYSNVDRPLYATIYTKDEVYSWDFVQGKTTQNTLVFGTSMAT